MTTTETIEELEKLHQRLQAKSKNMFGTMPSEDWKKAFDLYNIMNDANLKMGCRPCYGKVLWFLGYYIKKLKAQ